MHTLESWLKKGRDLFVVMCVPGVLLLTGLQAHASSETSSPYKIFRVISGEVVWAGGYDKSCLP